ncbi:MAG: LCP family protein [Defluviitaleaceae bacterium]|nr:LCP family protein [Defluviitaleaceae bacterium]
MVFLKQHWFKILILLPFVSVGILIDVLDRFTGIDESMRLWIAFVLITGSVSLFFFGLFLEFSKGNLEKKKIQLNVGRFKFGMIEIMRLAFSVLILVICYVTFTLMTIGIRIERIITNVTVPAVIAQQVERSYSLVAMAGFDIDNQGSYGRIGVLSLTDTSIEMAIEDFLSEQNLIPNFVSTTFASPLDMIVALYSDEIDAMVIESSFVQNFDEDERFRNVGNETFVLSQFMVEVEKEHLERTEMVPGEPFSMLILGLDASDDGDLTMGRFDTLMLLTVNVENLSFTLVSIPRDTWAYIPCFHHYDRLGHTGGNPACAVRAVESILDMEIPHYAVVNFNGVLDIVDVLGGLTIDVPFSFSEQDSRNRFGNHLIEVEAGVQRLNSEQVLALARFRGMVNHDFGRAENGQLVMEALIREMLSNMTSVSDVLPILEMIGHNVQTNFTAHELTLLAQYMLEYVAHIRNINLMEEAHFIQMVIFGDPIQMHGMDVMLLWPARVAEARRFMMINLGLEAPQFAFEFAFDGFLPPRRAWGEITHAYGSSLSIDDDEWPLVTWPTDPTVPFLEEQPFIPSSPEGMDDDFGGTLDGSLPFDPAPTTVEPDLEMTTPTPPSDLDVAPIPTTPASDPEGGDPATPEDE